MSALRLFWALKGIPLATRASIVISNARGDSVGGKVATAIYYTYRFLQGARRVESARRGCGHYSADGVDVDFGGNCPVQGYGTIDEFYCYYRSRGEGWELEVYDVDPQETDVLPAPLWDYGERAYFWPDGGWISPAESCRNIAKAVELLRAKKASLSMARGDGGFSV